MKYWMAEIHMRVHSRDPTGNFIGTNVSIPVLRLNEYYDYVGVYGSLNDCTKMMHIEDPALFVVSAPHNQLVSAFQYFQGKHFRQLLLYHHIRVPSGNRTQMLREMLLEHICLTDCQALVYAFRIRPRPRASAKVRLIQCRMVIALNYPRAQRRVSLSARHVPVNLEVQTADRLKTPEISLDEEFDGENRHLDIVDVVLKKNIIKEWQDSMKTGAQKRVVCAVCARRTNASDVACLPATTLPLEILRNDELPEKVIPTTYNFTEYNRALLHPAGLLDREKLGGVLVCATCEKSLCQKKCMPKFALANWLYHGYDELPSDVTEAFNAATRFDLRLISRARASRICVRFTDLPSRQPGDTKAAVAQRFSKGNIMVMPQDVTDMCDILPPGPESLKDTMSVLFVLNRRLDKAIIERMQPILVRKSRVRKMIEFLLEHNPHYQKDTGFQGFSQENMDAVFDRSNGNNDEAIPACVEIGHITANDATIGATAEYTFRNEIEEVPVADTRGGLLMENVGFTSGDNSPLSYTYMKMRAVRHCLEGGKFIRSLAGSRFIPDFENEHLLTWLFPHLDPWGIAGFHHPRRTKTLTLKDQLSYLLSVEGSKFEKDPDFAFVYYNIVQKKTVYDNVQFKVPYYQHKQITRQILNLDQVQLAALQRAFVRNPEHRPSSASEKAILKVLAQVSLIGHKIPGTTAYKLALRNEIRGAINFRGTPTLFITLNPSDTHHPLVRLLAGEDIVLEDIARGEDLDDWGRKLVAARNPAACAIFFHTMIQNFLHIVLRYGRTGRGLFGTCEGYYGTVEAQGRGTLHCHLLVWLAGHLPPQKLRDAMDASVDYKSRVFRWLESIIRTELLECTEVVTEPHGHTLPRPNRREETGDPHPGVIASPDINTLSADNFEREYVAMVNALVKEYNWHVHSATCWKYLGKNEPRDDAHCRMRIDGHTQERTELDPATKSIILRRLHPRIASYNDMVIFLMKCNMDIKFIGSGEAAKALLYYITDYITKASLPTHVGLAALSYAIEKTSSRLSDTNDTNDKIKRGSLTVVVNSMMAIQEISHQQVMSYLVGGGDHYKSDEFVLLYWGTFSRHVDHEFHESYDRRQPHDNTGGNYSGQTVNTSGGNEGQGASGEESERRPTMDPDDNVAILHLGPKSITASNQKDDYIYRSTEPEFESLCLYDFVANVRKTTVDRKKSEVTRAYRADSGETENQTHMHGHFSVSHPQHFTHMLRLRRFCRIPVILGERMARSDRGIEEKQVWARAMLVLFKPWRHPFDLKVIMQTWADAFDSYRPHISDRHMKIIHNMGVLAECKDARNESARQRNCQQQQQMPADNSAMDDLFDEAAYWIEEDNPYELFENSGVDSIPDPLDSVVGMDCRKVLHRSLNVPRNVTPINLLGFDMDIASEPPAGLKDHIRTMNGLKRKRRPDFDLAEGQPSQKRSHNDSQEPETAIRNIASTSLICGPVNLPVIVDEIIDNMHLRENNEQLRAFRIVANHIQYGGQQLLMYVAGVGVTGKSHIIHAIVKLFEHLGRRNELMLSAPTGIAAVLIGGHTIHALTMLPDKARSDFTELRSLWAKGRWLIVDEVSMISAKFLSQISDRLRQAKGEDQIASHLPFGGVNVIFTGDFGQLKPVRQSALYAHQLIKRSTFAECRDGDGVSSLNGAFLWRQVSVVVKLTKNVRQQNDCAYADFLSRLRLGECHVGSSGMNADIEMLRERELSKLLRTHPESIAQLHDVPVIVGSRKVRDALNATLINYHARRLGQTVSLYYSKDYIRRDEVKGDLREKLWNVSSSQTEDALGRIPIFCGMKVMVTTNLAISRGIVNGAEGVVQDILYTMDNEGHRYASVVYVRVKKSGSFAHDLDVDVVPVFPERKSFEVKILTAAGVQKRNVSRIQLPLIPAYAYTDYKSQGRSLEKAVVDLASARSLQGVYVMLSRVRSIQGLIILRWFPATKVYQRLSEELRDELKRVDHMSTISEDVYARAISSENYPATILSFPFDCAEAAAGRS